MKDLISARGEHHATQAKTTRRALLIGVQYHNEALHLNTATDVRRMKDALVERLGFDAQQIQELNTKESTTSSAIRRALRDFADSITPGDVAVIYYAGHGDSIADDNGDEMDGTDEVIVGSEHEKGTTTALIRDDHIGSELLRMSAASRILCFFDSCYSGTAARGGKDRKLPPGYAIDASSKPDSTAAQCDAPEVNAGNLLFFAAATSAQRAWETEFAGEPCGAFTTALVQAIRSGNVTDRTTARDLNVQVTNLIQDRMQTPTLNGDPDLPLFTGLPRKGRRYFEIEKEPGTLSGLILRAGLFDGVREGTVICVTAGDPREEDAEKVKAAQVATFKIMSVGPYTSKLEWVSGKTSSECLSLQPRPYAVEGIGGAGSLKLNALADASLPRGQIEDILSRAGFSNITFDNLGAQASPAQFMVSKSAEKGNAIEVRRPNGSIFGRYELSSASVAEELRRDLEREHVARFLVTLENRSVFNAVSLEVRFVPIDAEVADVGGTWRSDLALATGDPRSRMVPAFMSGDFVRVEVRNTGTLPFYCSIVNVAAWPSYIYPGADLINHPVYTPISADRKWTGLKRKDGSYEIYRLDVPRDVTVEDNTLIVLATTERVDLSFVNESVRASRGPKPALESLLEKQSSMRTRGPSALGSPSDVNWSTAKVLYEIHDGSAEHRVSCRVCKERPRSGLNQHSGGHS